MKMNQKGFSMLELLIAVAILALVAVPIFSSVVLSAKYTARNDLQADCLRLAENELERQKAAANFTALVGAKIEGNKIACLSTDDVPDENGVYTVDGKTLQVEIQKLAERCYAVTVTVSPVEETDAASVQPIVLKGVCSYANAS